MNKIKVGVLFGGESGEHEVSIISARSILNHIDKTKFDVTPIYINKKGEWLLEAPNIRHLLSCESSQLLQHRFDEITEPNSSAHMIAKFTPASKETFDVVFPVLHGPYGEDGTIQGLFEMANIPYVGAGVLGSAIGMDKEIAKRLALAAQIKIAPYVLIRKTEWISKTEDLIHKITQQLDFPVFVKPANLGSSVGTHKVNTLNELKPAIEDALRFDHKVLVEKGIRCREIELAVLENLESGKAPLVSIPGEIKPTLEFYSYEAKYVDPNGADLCIPADLSPKQISEAQEMAVKLFNILECQGMARVDLFWDCDNEEFIFNEINTLPGFTHISMYPKLFEASGLAYSDLITHLLELALKRHEEKTHCRYAQLKPQR